jgi:hypothetical protein
MYLTAPPIARLVGHQRLWAWVQIKRGRFGPVLRRRGRALEVELANVEAALGRTFSPEQLSAAGIHIPTYEEVSDGSKA